MNQLARQSTSLQTLEGQQTLAMRLKRELGDMPGPDEVVEAAKLLMAPFPHLKPADAQGYVDTMVAHLSKYPRFVLEQTTDPRTGVVTLCTFPPVIAEVEKFAMPIWNASHRQLRRADEAVKQLAAPAVPDVSAEERAEMSDRLKDLSKSLATNLDMQKSKRKPDPRTRCNSGDAIRNHMGIPQATQQQTATTKT